MKTAIFYFSGTGNSLMLAKDLKLHLGEETEIINMAAQDAGMTAVNYEKVGFVFPVYFGDVPPIVIQFVNKLDMSKTSYVFAVTNYGGMVVNTMHTMAALIAGKGKKLNYSAEIAQPGNYLVMYGANPEDRQKKVLAEGKTKTAAIALAIQNGIENSVRKISFFEKCMGWFMHAVMLKKITTYDTNFTINEACIDCGVCEKVCPRNNIDNTNGKRSWKGNCEQCMACIQWCPKEAIQYKKVTQKRKRYHNPEVQAKDLYLR